MMSRLSLLLTALIALALTALLLGAAWVVLVPSGPALSAATFGYATLSPNADGVQDVVQISYTLRRPAQVSIYFEDAQGQRFYYRRDKVRDAGDLAVLFSGVVEPYTLPTDNFEGELLARVLQNGTYTWFIAATENGVPSGVFSGPLTITDADTALPVLQNFTISPPAFSPNQDGINDRTNINVWLEKEVAEDGLQMALLGPDGAELVMAEQVSGVKFGQRGLHTYDYDGGIDQGVEPPPDGTYFIRATVQDRLGQWLVLTRTLTIVNSGLPRAEILYGDVDWSAQTLVEGETLYFTITVENYGTSPIRTSGPFAGTVYDSMYSNASSLGFYDESGAWRIGINCEICERDYPWRWALGTAETLTPLVENGKTYYYLLPGQRAVVTGGIVLDRYVDERNPQYFWAGLIHEDVGIAIISNRVDPEFVTVVPK